MPELRTDWLTGRSVLIAEKRAQRPIEFSAGAATHVLRACPFCVGNEHLTPPSLFERCDAAGEWQKRVVENMFPAVTLATDGQSVVAASDGSPGAVVAPAFGAHEVIIESRAHLERMSELSEAGLHDVLECYAHRLSHWRNDGRFAYGTIFKNQGPAAGASLSHLHSQLVALPAVPADVGAEVRRAEEDFHRHGSCPYCRLIESERAAETRVVFDQHGYVAFCPFASWQPHEVWIMPTSHEPAFELAGETGLRQLARVLKPLVDRFESLVPDAACNWLLRTAPWKGGCEGWCHWRLELLPRVHAFAGLEIGTGIHINPLPPERAARTLRDS